jgi:hypothetical protein
MFKNQESINRQLKETTAFLDYEQVKVRFSIPSETLSIPTNYHRFIEKTILLVYNHFIKMSRHSGIEVEALLGYTLEQNHKS